MTRHPLRPLVALATVVLGLVLAGCGSSGDDTATATAFTGATGTEASTATTAATTDTAASGNSADSTPAGTPAADPAATVIEATVTGGEVTAAEDRFDVAQGSAVLIRVTSDVEEPVHLHGYDIEADAAPGRPAEIAFTADIPGVFEVELEDSGTLLFEIEVK
ncbi:MAG: hypothetical protein OEY41_15470 [Acidimicrobiia bacterium]|nr:hypothetical protein [Acidimicrobiia bacterium]MDH5291393.1 hypothetical protein [Acidimicrobiia bacterium]